MSSFNQVIVTQLKNLQPHSNADLLLVGEFDGMPFIVNKNDSKDGDWRAIVAFDMCVPNEEMWPEFVRGQRVRPIRLRGIFSMAVALPVPVEDRFEGKDITDKYEFTKWIPPEEQDDYPDGVELQSTGKGRQCSAPSSLTIYKYDLESLRKYHSEFSVGEQVIITEKLEGENISVVYWDNQLHVKSRNRWIADGNNKWWNAVRKYDWSWLQANPGLVAMGEKYGNVNRFRYDCPSGEEKIRLFDFYDATKGNFLDWPEYKILVTINNALNIPINHPFYETDIVPVLYEGPWLGLSKHKHLAEGKSTIGDNIREGFVIQPIKERLTGKFQRVKYKMHGEQFLIQKGKIK